VAAAPVAPAPLKAAAALDPVQQFGMSRREVEAKEVAAGSRAAPVDRLEVRLASLTRSPGGLKVFTLENGQVWRALVTSEDLLLNAGDTITISRGVLGSYTLTTSTGRLCKVKRVR
jgi:hypothetical protein